MTGPLVTGALAGGVLSVVLYSWYRSKHSVPLPPGPKGNLILGSALDIRNASAFWLKFAEYADQYGPIISVRILHQYTIIVSDPNIVSELFEKRAANYSDRRVNQMVKLIGWDKDLVFLQYGPTLKLYRTMLQRALNNRVALDYVPLQQLEVRKFMRRLVEKPNDFMENVHLMAASITIRMAYGYKVLSSHDPVVQTAEELMAGFSEAMTPAKWAVDMFPPLRHLPVWFPLATFQRRAQSLRNLSFTHSEEPFKHVEKEMADGTAEDSFTSKLLLSEDGEPVDKEMKEHIKSIASTLYAAGSDTTVSILQSFFLAMTLYPDVQSKSQTEIATYLRQRSIDNESSRMISPSDRPNLPYTSAVVRELIRWHPAVNIAAHRSSNEDDNNVVWEGNTYRIPAQTLVLANIWKMMHDPDVYEQPDRFMPERYLVSKPPPEPEVYAFGFGRRICPGMHVAQQSMWISISNTLANFDISKAKDENGLDITPEENYTSGIISHPLPFKCNITPKEGSKQWLLEEIE